MCFTSKVESPMNLIQALDLLFQQQRNSSQARKQEAYMRNQFLFLGISKPLRAQYEKEIFKSYPLTSNDELKTALHMLWQKSEREFHYAACTLAHYYKHMWDQALLKNFEYMIRHKSWWDTVDNIAVHLVGSLVHKNLGLLPIMDQWIQDENLWIRRSAIIFQLRWKEKTDEKRLFDYCILMMHEKDFFIRKAIGWVLREYSKTKPLSVAHFIGTYHTELSTLSIKEGSKYLSKQRNRCHD